MRSRTKEEVELTNDESHLSLSIVEEESNDYVRWFPIKNRIFTCNFMNLFIYHITRK